MFQNECLDLAWNVMSAHRRARRAALAGNAVLASFHAAEAAHWASRCVAVSPTMAGYVEGWVEAADAWGNLNE